MTHKTITRLLVALAAIFAINTACTNEYKDMQPGEVRLKENDYRNDDKIRPVTITPSPEEEAAGTEVLHMSDLELRTLWHAVVIGAERKLENGSETEKNLYSGPMDVEETFYRNISGEMDLLQEQYPQQYEAIVGEWQRAGVHAIVHYTWCAMADEYVNLKFRATPTASQTPPADGDVTPPAGQE